MQVGAIVPFNYPFHNIFNPLMAAVFAGNSIVIKVLPASQLGALKSAQLTTAAQAALTIMPERLGDAGVGACLLVCLAVWPHH